MRKLIVAVGIITLLATGAYLTKYFNNLRVQARDKKLNEDVENLFSALQKYKEHVGVYPVGGNAEVAKALKGLHDFLGGSDSVPRDLSSRSLSSHSDDLAKSFDRQDGGQQGTWKKNTRFTFKTWTGQETELDKTVK